MLHSQDDNPEKKRHKVGDEYVSMIHDKAKSSRRFTTTDGGYQFFKRYDELTELIEPIATITENTRR